MQRGRRRRRPCLSSSTKSPCTASISSRGHDASRATHVDQLYQVGILGHGTWRHRALHFRVRNRPPVVAVLRGDRAEWLGRSLSRAEDEALKGLADYFAPGATARSAAPSM